MNGYNEDSRIIQDLQGQKNNKQVLSSNDLIGLTVKIVSQTGTTSSGDNIYQGTLCNPFNPADTPGPTINNLVAYNEYEYMAGDLAKIGYSSGGLLVLETGGRFNLSDGGYGIYFSP